MSLVSKVRTRAAEGTRSLALSLGLLVLRLGLGGAMAYGHGWDKLQQLLAGKGKEFADPLHIGSTLSLGLATFAEFACAILVAIGLATRLACLPLIVTMGVATFVVHGPQVLDGAQNFGHIEKAILYLAAFLALLLTGPGIFSVDALFSRRKRHRD